MTFTCRPFTHGPFTHGRFARIIGSFIVSHTSPSNYISVLLPLARYIIANGNLQFSGTYIVTSYSDNYIYSYTKYTCSFYMHACCTADALTVFQVTFCPSQSDGTSNRIICLNIHKNISSLHPWTVIYEAHNRLHCRISCPTII